ncbi:MAG TPA: type II toxin-antitoxin system RelE/ParE family toxin, partial [Planctomycetaceae bacterium]|nr:type II toxin-antitoxin system RelE/ParE family toxin [Planctomycetaceae bacterium]
ARRRKIIWTEESLHDLETVAEYIARDSGRYAAAFVRRVREVVRSTQRLPESGARVLEVEDQTIREVFAFNYRVVYQISANAITVLRIIHASRDFDSAWN